VGPGPGLNAADKRKTYTHGGNLTVVTIITVDSVKHNNSFIQCYRSNMFRPKGPSSVGKNGCLNTRVFSGN